MWTPMPKGIAGSRRKVLMQGLDATRVDSLGMVRCRGKHGANPLDISQVFKPVRNGRFAATEIAGHAYPRQRTAGGRVIYPKGF